MGGRHSKRSVDITGTGKDADDTQPLDGKLEKIEEGAKVAVNGASHSEPKITPHEEQVSNGDPVSLPEPVPVAEVAGPSSPTAEAEEETAESDVIQPPKKKEKVKKKWSFRSISFSKKDKSKPGKDETTKDDAEAVPEVAEEKTNDAPSFMSSMTDAIGSATEVVGDAVVAAEHKVEEGLTATQDQVEKISAKVAERAEALVVKMEAMTVKAVDAAQEMVGLGNTTVAEVDKAEIALTEAVTTNVALPEVSKIDSALSEATTTNVVLPEAAKIESALTEALTTNIILPETAKMDSVLSEAFTTNVVLPESVTCDVVLPKAVSTDVELPEVVSPKIVLPLHNGMDIPVAAEEVVALQEIAVTKGEEMPPPLPASPPPSAVIADMVSDVVDTAMKLGEAKEMDSCVEKLVSTLPNKAVSPTTKCVPMVFSETEDSGAGGDKLPPCVPVPSEVTFSVSVQSCRHSDLSLNDEVVTQVIEPTDHSVTSFDLSDQLEENVLYENEADSEPEPQNESAKSASETSMATEGGTGPEAKKAAEE